MDSYNKICMIIRKTDLINYDEKDELHLYLMNLKDQVKKQKEVIDKAIEYINKHSRDENGDIGINLFADEVFDLLDILKEVRK